MFQNMQSLFNKRDTLQAFLDDLNEPLLAFCVSETWLTQTKAELTHFENYHIAAAFHRETRNEGGVSILLLRDNVKYTENREIMAMSVEYVLETCAIELPDLDLLSIVLHWNNRDIDIFYAHLRLILDTCKQKKKKILLAATSTTTCWKNQYKQWTY
jgi:hypothetical protein